MSVVREERPFSRLKEWIERDVLELQAALAIRNCALPINDDAYGPDAKVISASLVSTFESPLDGRRPRRFDPYLGASIEELMSVDRSAQGSGGSRSRKNKTKSKHLVIPSGHIPKPVGEERIVERYVVGWLTVAVDEFFRRETHLAYQVIVASVKDHVVRRKRGLPLPKPAYDAIGKERFEIYDLDPLIAKLLKCPRHKFFAHDALSSYAWTHASARIRLRDHALDKPTWPKV